MKKNCIVCKVSFEKRYTCSLSEWSRSKFCSRKCKGEWQSKNCVGKKSLFRNYKGGTITKNGYRSISVFGKRVYEHRYVMEQFIGRKLQRDENVHHINHNKKDNRIENLQLVKKSEHSKIHAPKGSYIGRNKTVYID